MLGKTVVLVVILWCTAIESVQPTLILLNALKKGAQQTRCKLHQIGSKVFDHEHKQGDPCEDSEEISTVAGQPLGLEGPQSGYVDSEDLHDSQTQQLNGHSYGPSPNTTGQTYLPTGSISGQYPYIIPPNNNQYEPSRRELYGSGDSVNGQQLGIGYASAGAQNVGYNVGNGLGTTGGSIGQIVGQKPGNGEEFGSTGGKNVGYIAGNSLGSGYGATDNRQRFGPTGIQHVGYIPGNGFTTNGASFDQNLVQQRGNGQGYGLGQNVLYEASNGLGPGYGATGGTFGQSAGYEAGYVGQQPGNGQGFGSNSGNGYRPGNFDQRRGSDVRQGFGVATGNAGLGFDSTSANFGQNVAPEADNTFREAFEPTPANLDHQKPSSNIGQSVDLIAEIPLNHGATVELAPSGSIGQKAEPIIGGGVYELHGAVRQSQDLTTGKPRENLGNALKTGDEASARFPDQKMPPANNSLEQQKFGPSETTEKSNISFVYNNDISKADPEVTSVSSLDQGSSTSESAIDQLEDQANKTFGQGNSQLEIVENRIDGNSGSSGHSSATSETHPRIDVRAGQDELTTKKFVPVPSGGGRHLGSAPCKDEGTISTSDGCLEIA